MAGCRGLVSLALLCLWLCHNSLAKNDLPCQPSKWNNAFDTFQKRHVPSGAPHSMDQNVWEDYIRKHGCNRPTQSFLDPSDLERVKAVCSSQGGKRHKENLCISSQPFTFFTVRSDIGTCGIRNVRKETKHLILACELLDNQCLPVHFEGNTADLKPDNNARGCQAAAAGLKASWLWLLLSSALLLLMCSQ
ncbi:hypothetical protein N1851_030106 [Merluccius polli]|uniref:Ribonuclease A-domain domain-containing protein n=1 Tax=Merluccius polli TaxID=89951 RepID=A0AA47NR47_MERPO|nr:hypothetical protein N1851_030106 [Merluccius polli]